MVLLHTIKEMGGMLRGLITCFPIMTIGILHKITQLIGDYFNWNPKPMSIMSINA